MAELKLELEGLEVNGGGLPEAPDFSLGEVRRTPWRWDKVVKSSHLTNCAYQQACNFNLYVKDGVVVREEQDKEERQGVQHTGAI